MQTKSPVPQRPPNATEFAILLSLTGKDMHGYAIMQEVEQRSDGTLRLGPGTFYGAIKRMIGNGWIAEVEAPAKDDPRRTCLYRLTRSGRTVAAAHADRLAQTVSLAVACGLISMKPAL